MLAMIITFIIGNLKDYLMKQLILLKHLIMEYFICYDFNKIRVKLDGGYLTQDQATILHGGIVSIYIVYEISKKVHISNYLTLENCLFGTAKLTKNGDIDKYGYSGYGIGFDRYGPFFISWHWIRQKYNFWSRFLFINNDR